MAFLLGVSLILGSISPWLIQFQTSGSRTWLSDSFQKDYQNTQAFRNYMSGYLERFLSMATGGSVSGAYFGSDCYVFSGSYESAYSGNAILESGAYDYDYDWYGDINEEPSQEERERIQRQIEAAQRYFQEDKNVLYRISYEGKELYTNTDSSLSTLPEGYNFRLYFDGQKATAVKDGVELDIYGDGLYTEESPWYLPGYRNFTVDEQTAKATVTIAVAQTPALYVKGNYAKFGSEQQYNRLYWLDRNLKATRAQAVGSAACIGAGLILLGVCFLLRRDKAAADRAVARTTGRVWFEVKLLVFLAALLALLFPWGENFQWALREVSYAIQDGGWGYSGFWLLKTYLSEMLSQPFAMVLAFLTGYFFINDMRHGDKPWRRGVFGMLSAKELTRPIQKRIVRRNAIVCVLVLLTLCSILCCVWLLQYHRYGRLFSFLFSLLCFALLTAMAFLNAVRSKKLAQDLEQLCDQITAVRDGDLTSSLPLPQESDLYATARELADIQCGMKRAVEEQTRSERMKVELVANVSHDIKTPLTSIISYAELLSKEEGLPEHVKDYIRILNQKAERLRNMVQDVFDVSKAASGNLPVTLEALDLGKLLRQTLADMSEPIAAAPVVLRDELPLSPVMIRADGQRLYRVFQNLLQNALSYALEGSRVYVTLETADGVATASVKNTSKVEFPAGTDFTERFVRGDASRSDGGSGLGLSIVETFTEACGGSFQVELVADLFVATVRFPLLSE